MTFERSASLLDKEAVTDNDDFNMESAPANQFVLQNQRVFQDEIDFRRPEKAMDTSTTLAPRPFKFTEISQSQDKFGSVENDKEMVTIDKINDYDLEINQNAFDKEEAD